MNRSALLPLALILSVTVEHLAQSKITISIIDSLRALSNDKRIKFKGGFVNVNFVARTFHTSHMPTNTHPYAPANHHSLVKVYQRIHI